MLPSHSASAATKGMVPRRDPAMRFMFHLACNLLHGESDTTGVALPCSPHPSPEGDLRANHILL